LNANTSPYYYFSKSHVSKSQSPLQFGEHNFERKRREGRKEKGKRMKGKIKKRKISIVFSKLKV